MLLIAIIVRGIEDGERRHDLRPIYIVDTVIVISLMREMRAKEKNCSICCAFLAVKEA